MRICAITKIDKIENTGKIAEFIAIFPPLEAGKHGNFQFYRFLIGPRRGGIGRAGATIMIFLSKFLFLQDLYVLRILLLNASYKFDPSMRRVQILHKKLHNMHEKRCYQD